MSPELDTLDILCGMDEPLSMIRQIFNDDARFQYSVAAMLHDGDVRLWIEDDEVPRWHWREVLRAACEPEAPDNARLSITRAGARRV